MFGDIRNDDIRPGVEDSAKGFKVPGQWLREEEVIEQLLEENEGTIPIGNNDPNGIDQHTAGAKLDKGKADMSLLLDFGLALEQVAVVGTAGMNKYTRRGWLDVYDGTNRYTAALLRHLISTEENGRDAELEQYSDGNEILHSAQVAWNALARLELDLRKHKRLLHEGNT